MKHRPHLIQRNAYAGAFTFSYLCAEPAKEHLHVTPCNVRADGIGEDRFERLGVLLAHVTNSITM